MAKDAKDAKENDAPPAAPRLCFVIGPIGKDGEDIRKHSDLLLHSVIKHVLQAEPFRYHVKRADEDSDPGMIGDRVITDLLKAELVVADLTNLNPNAFYELGIRHASEKPTIHIARAGTALPFDNIAHRTIFVDLADWHSTEKARQELASMAKFIEQPDFKVSNPITQANASFKMRESADPKDRILATIHEDVLRIKAELSGAIADPTKIQLNDYDESIAKLKTIIEESVYLTGSDLRTIVKKWMDRAFFPSAFVFETHRNFEVVLIADGGRQFSISLDKRKAMV